MTDSNKTDPYYRTQTKLLPNISTTVLVGDSWAQRSTEPKSVFRRFLTFRPAKYQTEIRELSAEFSAAEFIQALQAHPDPFGDRDAIQVVLELVGQARLADLIQIADSGQFRGQFERIIAGRLSEPPRPEFLEALMNHPELQKYCRSTDLLLFAIGQRDAKLFEWLKTTNPVLANLNEQRDVDFSTFLLEVLECDASEPAGRFLSNSLVSESRRGWSEFSSDPDETVSGLTYRRQLHFFSTEFRKSLEILVQTQPERMTAVFRQSLRKKNVELLLAFVEDLNIPLRSFNFSKDSVEFQADSDFAFGQTELFRLTDTCRLAMAVYQAGEMIQAPRSLVRRAFDSSPVICQALVDGTIQTSQELEAVLEQFDTRAKAIRSRLRI